MNKKFFTAAVLSGLACLNTAFADNFMNGDSRYEDPTDSFTEKKVVNERAFADEVKLQEDQIAKENSQKQEEKKEAPPVNLKADHCEYDNYTGDFYAEGNVEIVQGQELIKTVRAHGNMKTGDVYLEEGGELIETDNRTHGEWLHYNFNTKTGEIKKVKGQAAGDMYHAPRVLITPEKLIADQGGVSQRCPAVKHVPCLSITAKTFEIFPQEKMVAHDVKVFIKGKQIYARDTWVNRFKEKPKDQWIPKIGYDGKDNGFVLGYRHTYDFDSKNYYTAELFKYTKGGFRPNRKFVHDERNWKFTYSNGWEGSSDEWVFKQNNMRLDYKNHHFAKNFPLSYDAYASNGLWHSEKLDKDNNWGDGQPNTWHREYAFYIRHDPIHFFNSDKNALSLSVGRRWSYERRTNQDEFNNTAVNEYSATLTQKWGSNVNTWLGYYRSDRELSAFETDRPDMSIEGRQGISYSPDKNNTFSIVNRYDISKSREYGVTYKWHHMFCCWALDVQFDHYRECAGKDSKLSFMYYFFNL